MKIYLFLYYFDASCSSFGKSIELGLTHSRHKPFLNVLQPNFCSMLALEKGNNVYVFYFSLVMSVKKNILITLHVYKISINNSIAQWSYWIESEDFWPAGVIFSYRGGHWKLQRPTHENLSMSQDLKFSVTSSVLLWKKKTRKTNGKIGHEKSAGQNLAWILLQRCEWKKYWNQEMRRRGAREAPQKAPEWKKSASIRIYIRTKPETHTRTYHRRRLLKLMGSLT